MSDGSVQEAGSREVSASQMFFKVTSTAGQDFTNAQGKQPVDKQSLWRGATFFSEYSEVFLYNRVGIKDFQGEILKTL